MHGGDQCYGIVAQLIATTVLGGQQSAEIAVVDVYLVLGVAGWGPKIYTGDVAALGGVEYACHP